MQGITGFDCECCHRDQLWSDENCFLQKIKGIAFKSLSKKSVIFDKVATMQAGQ